MSRYSSANDLLCSGHFFYECLHFALRKSGLPETHLKYGVGLYIAGLSRAGPQPLRVYIDERTPGDATFLMRCVGRLMPTSALAGVFRRFDEAWPQFRNKPDEKLLYLPTGAEILESPEFAIDISGDRVDVDWAAAGTRRETAIGSFVVVSAEEPPYDSRANRWLTIRLPKLKDCEVGGTCSLDESERTTWHQVQESIGTRLRSNIEMPIWERRVFEEMNRDYRKRRHKHALSKIWRVISAIRSFGSMGPTDVRADFDSYAATALLLRSSFREGWAIPSAQKLYREIAPNGSRTSVVNPANGAGKRYEHWIPAKTDWRRLF